MEPHRYLKKTDAGSIYLANTNVLVVITHFLYQRRRGLDSDELQPPLSTNLGDLPISFLPQPFPRIIDTDALLQSVWKVVVKL